MNFEQDFIQTVIILVLTAILTGVLVPWTKSRWEAINTRSQKKFEADLLRQNKMVEDQIELLDDLTDTMWDWRYLSMKVVYYGLSSDKEEEEKYKSLATEYDKRIWDILSRLRKLMGTSLRISSIGVHKDLVKFYDQCVEIDIQITSLIRRKGIDGTPRLDGTIRNKFRELNQEIGKQITKDIDQLINTIAVEFQLKEDM